MMSVPVMQPRRQGVSVEMQYFEAAAVTQGSNRAIATPMTLALAVALTGAGLIHCLLTPEHMAMSAVFGAGFLAAGVGQLVMAAAAIVRPSRFLYAAVIASTVVLSTLYAFNVFVGLPLQPSATAAAVDDTVDEHEEEPAGHASGEADHSDDAAHTDGDDHDASAETDHHEDGLALGGGEPVDAFGAVTQTAQLTAAAIAAVLLGRSRRSTV